MLFHAKPVKNPNRPRHFLFANNQVGILLYEVGHTTIEVVDGRELHGFLEIKEPYGPWIVRQIRQGGLIEHHDYEAEPHYEAKSPYRVKSTEYAIELRKAKSIAMGAPGKKGDEVRDYFIDRHRMATPGMTEEERFYDFLRAVSQKTE